MNLNHAEKINKNFSAFLGIKFQFIIKEAFDQVNSYDCGIETLCNIEQIFAHINADLPLTQLYLNKNDTVLARSRVLNFLLDFKFNPEVNQFFSAITDNNNQNSLFTSSQSKIDVKNKSRKKRKIQKKKESKKEDSGEKFIGKENSKKSNKKSEKKSKKNSCKKFHISNFIRNRHKKRRINSFSECYEEKEKCTPINIKKRKIVIIGDSQIRGLSEIIRSKLNINMKDFIVTSSCRPNAKLSQILSEIEYFTKDLTFEDFLIVLGGSNDVADINIDLKVIDSLLDDVLRISKEKTNVIFCHVPPRFDFPKDSQCNRNVGILNRKIDSYSKKSRSFVVLNFYFLKRNYFTRHGLHFNYTGKQAIGDEVITYMTLFYNNFLAQRSLSNYKIV